MASYTNAESEGGPLICAPQLVRRPCAFCRARVVVLLYISRASGASPDTLFIFRWRKRECCLFFFSFFFFRKKCIIPVGTPVAADGNKHGKKVLGVSNGGECQNINPQNASEKCRRETGATWKNRLSFFYDPCMWFKQTTTIDYIDLVSLFFYFWTEPCAVLISIFTKKTIKLIWKYFLTPIKQIKPQTILSH